MRSGLLGLAIAGVSGFAAIVGCSADGAGDVVGEGAPTDPGTSPAQLPPSSSGGGSSGGEVDSGKPPTAKDAGKDSAVDAGPPPPVPGTPCAKLDEVRQKTCGACGKQETICLAGAGGAGAWSEYGACTGELAGGCIPGTVVTEACGNCGTQTRTCTAYCAFTTSACAGQPAGACVPGNVDLSNAGCSVADTFRQRTCGSACTYGSFSSSCSAPPSSVEVGPTVGSVTSTIAIVDASDVLSRPSGTCPNATLSTTVSTPYTYVTVHNPLAKSATVAIYNSLPTGGVAFKTVLAAYDGSAPPVGDAARKACVKLRTYGTTALTGDSKYASLDGTAAVTLAPGASVSVFVGAYNAYDATKPADSTGKVKLNVQTMSLQ